MIHYSLGQPECFANHAQHRRSGHMGHALLETAPGVLLAFYSNTDGDRFEGHSGYGWMEYKRSDDGGQTWSSPEILPYSKAMYEAGEHTALCEKAVCCDDGSILLFFAITDASRPLCSEPWSEPTMVRSRDGGQTWTEAVSFGAAKGRVYDALYHEGRVYVLSLKNDGAVYFCGNKEEHVFTLHTSDDHGETFYKASELPIRAMGDPGLPVQETGKGYGALAFTREDRLIAYVYVRDDETHLEYCVSEDFGKNWSAPQRTLVARKIRNPQVVRVGDCWFLHGRNGGQGNALVLYTSEDGIRWDDGRILASCKGGGLCYYSNNLAVSRFSADGPDSILIQYSDAYDRNRVNVMHIWLTDIHRTL